MSLEFIILCNLFIFIYMENGIVKIFVDKLNK